MRRGSSRTLLLSSLLTLAILPPSTACADSDIDGLPSLRVAGGLTVNPSAGAPSGMFALTAGLRVHVGRDRATGLGLSGELGWNYLAGGLPESNYLSVTGGADIGGVLAQIGVHGTFLVGSAGGDLSLGGRATARLELIAGIFGLELGYEGREINGAFNHGVHVSAALDIGAIVFYVAGAGMWLSDHL